MRLAVMAQGNVSLTVKSSNLCGAQKDRAEEWYACEKSTFYILYSFSKIQDGITIKTTTVNTRA